MPAAPVTAWSTGDYAQLRANAHLGAEAIAAIVGRSVWSVRNAARRQRISLRRTGERRGKVLGEQRAGSWSGELAAARISQAAGDVNGTVVEQHLEHVAAAMRGERAPLCPACVSRPVTRARTGLCEVCHRHALAEAHRHASAQADAQRAYWTAKQQAHRTGGGAGATTEEEA
jgi:hypothetical protein